MRVVIQRVTQASVSIDAAKVAEIGPGLVVLLGIIDSDTSEDILWLSNKLTNLRIFNDAKAAKPEIAKPLYEQFVQQFESDLEQTVQTGEFGADMKVALINDGPVTIIIDSKERA
jgi:D-tyrosyl-tRNA(Tyr) deacylase